MNMFSFGWSLFLDFLLNGNLRVLKIMCIYFDWFLENWNLYIWERNMLIVDIFYLLMLLGLILYGYFVKIFGIFVCK